MKMILASYAVSILALLAAQGVVAAPIYLNDTNIDVEVGPGTSVGTFNNTFDGGLTIGKVIDAASADATEFHNQTTHIWFTSQDAGGGLELLFDFGQEYNITTLHFWNYTSEAFDVDDIEFTFFDGTNAQLGTLSLAPALGSSPGILAQDIVLPAPLNVRYVTTFLSGTNREVDFQNLGFTAEPVCLDLGGDTDGDTLCDDEDPCRHFANTLPLVISGFSGIPDECLCGDFDGDGFHSATDAAAINDCAAFLSLDCVNARDEIAEPCDAETGECENDGFYSATDADKVNRVSAFLDPAYTLTCELRPEGTCGGDTGVACF